VIPRIEWNVISRSELADHAHLSEAVYGPCAVSNIEHLAWKFLSNPEGPALAATLRDTGGLIGRLVAMPRRFVQRDAEVRAAYLVDLVIHPRARGVASLAALVGALDRLQGFDCLLVTPNEIGAAVWRDLAKLPIRGSLEAFAFPLRPMSLLSRRVRSRFLGRLIAVDRAWSSAATTLSRTGETELEWKKELPNAEDLQSLVAEEENSWRGERSRGFLAWRFLDSPVFRYELSFLWKAGKLVGWVATRGAEFENYRCFFIVDCISSRRMNGRERLSLRRAMLGRAAEQEFDLVLNLVSSSEVMPPDSCTGLPFLRIRQKWLPHGTPIFLRWSSAEQKLAKLPVPRMSLADLDIF